MKTILSNHNNPILGTWLYELPFLGNDILRQGDTKFALKCEDIDTNGNGSRYVVAMSYLKR